MPRKKMSDDERRRWEAQKAEWAETSRQFAENYERLKAKWREEDERRERRRRSFLRRLLFCGR
jgi:hypothetical protein